MKIKVVTKIGDKRIIRAIKDAVYDLEATRKKIAPMITPKMTGRQIDQLIIENLEYAKIGDEGELIDDTEALGVLEKLNAKGPNRALLDNGKYIDDFRGAEYWIKTSGRWKKEKIEKLGVGLPKGAILPSDITPYQRREIDDQNEAERVAGLTPEERTKERQMKIMERFAEIDRLRIRPVAAIAANTAVPVDYDTLAALNDEANTLRTELAAL